MPCTSLGQRKLPGESYLVLSNSRVIMCLAKRRLSSTKHLHFLSESAPMIHPWPLRHVLEDVRVVLTAENPERKYSWEKLSGFSK